MQLISDESGIALQLISGITTDNTSFLGQIDVPSQNVRYHALLPGRFRIVSCDMFIVHIYEILGLRMTQHAKFKNCKISHDLSFTRVCRHS